MSLDLLLSTIQAQAVARLFLELLRYTTAEPIRTVPLYVFPKSA